MRHLANLLVIASLIAGLFGAVTAYLPPLNLPDSQLVGLTLNAPAGLRPGGGAPQALASKNTHLTPELLAALRAGGVRRVLVKEFAWARWSGRWIFLLGCVGLAAGAALKRAGARQPRPSAAGPAGGLPSPERALAAICAAVDALRAELPGLPDAPARFRRTLEVLTDVQERLVPDFIALRPVLTARLGLGGYARLMDRFAAGERQLNRAWSAAADEIEPEVVDCLHCGGELLAETAAALGSGMPREP
ncbi:MAG TPA: hypothetical protein VMD31_11495 [Opitutaceae bacterium]|nr:hypothetical protein [Opitutaceae bacterium]